MHRYGGSLAFEAAMHESPYSQYDSGEDGMLKNAVLAGSIDLTVSTVPACFIAAHTRPTRKLFSPLRKNDSAPNTYTPTFTLPIYAKSNIMFSVNSAKSFKQFKPSRP